MQRFPRCAASLRLRPLRPARLEAAPRRLRALHSSAQRHAAAAASSAAPAPLYPLVEGRTLAAAPAAGALPEAEVDHVVIGAGVVGLAVARELARRWPERSTYLVERHARPGEETSSRNSEVIHAGLYYPVDSLKTRMCVRGRDLMYEYCAAKNVAHKQVTKLVVGPASAQGYLQKMVAHVDALPAAHRPQIRLVSGAEAREMEPDLSPDVGCAVHSLSTGIVSSHELMASFERDILEAECAEIVYGTRVLRIDPVVPAAGGSSKRGASADESGWIVQTQTGDSEHVDMLKARVVINAAGLNAPSLLNGLLRDGHFGSAPADWAAAGSGEGADEQRPLAAYYMKGNYATYKGEGARNVSRLIYPVPSGMAGSNDAHKHTSLGTHLTLDLDGNVRFGPDAEWLFPDASASADFWSRSLPALTPVPFSHEQGAQEARLDQMLEAIRSYLPGVQREGLAPDYAGIRPKLVPPGAAFRDFGVLLHDSARLEQQRIWQEALADAAPGTVSGAMITLAGIESPGLTSSLAIGELVADLVARRVWADARRTRVLKRQNVDHAAGLDGWA